MCVFSRPRGLLPCMAVPTRTFVGIGWGVLRRALRARVVWKTGNAREAGETRCPHLRLAITRLRAQACWGDLRCSGSSPRAGRTMQRAIVHVLPIESPLVKAPRLMGVRRIRFPPAAKARFTWISTSYILRQDSPGNGEMGVGKGWKGIRFVSPLMARMEDRQGLRWRSAGWRKRGGGGEGGVYAFRYVM